jgi:sugar phosphate isomerase/epimerase
MKISCSWLYAIAKHGYPPSMPDLHAALQDIAGLGFTSVELAGIREDNLRAVHADHAALKRRCADLGLTVASFRPVLPDLVHSDKGRRFQALDLFKLAVETAKALGCESITTVSYPPPVPFEGDTPYVDGPTFGQTYRVRVDPAFRWEDVWGWLVDSLGACADEAERSDLRFSLEPRAGELISNTDAMLRLMDAVEADNFGAVLDTAHLHAQKELLPLSVEKLGGRIHAVHAADNDGLSNLHLAPGRGTVDWDGVFHALQKQGFSGYVAVDVGDVPDVDAQYKDAKAFLESLAARLNA